MDLLRTVQLNATFSNSFSDVAGKSSSFRKNTVATCCVFCGSFLADLLKKNL